MTYIMRPNQNLKRPINYQIGNLKFRFESTWMVRAWSNAKTCIKPFMLREINKMPLNKGAKPGSKKFGQNIATEVKAGKPRNQAIAIAYSEAKQGKKRSKKK